MSLRTLQQHMPGPDCLGQHCHEHHVDEPGDGAYIVCFECGHVWRTKRELRRAYRRIFWATTKRGVRLHRRIWRVLTVRADDIHFCQHCIHDF